MMATDNPGDANILEGEAFNWRLIVFPVAALLILFLGGFAYYYHQLSEREELETNARTALVKAVTPEELLQVAEQFPGSDNGAQALASAGGAFFAKGDYAGSAKAYQRLLDNPAVTKDLREPAQLGLAAALEAQGRIDDAI